MDPEQAQEHSEEVTQEDISKLTALMDDNGSFGDLSEANDTEEGKEEPKKEAPQQQAQPQDPKSQQQPDPQGQAELVDVEIGGKTYKVPAEIKDGYLMQADYTRKTQEVATQRQTVEQQRAEVQRLALQAQQFVEHYAAIKQIDNELQFLQKIDPQQLAADPLKEIQVRQRALELSQMRQHVLGQIDQTKAHLNEQQAIAAQKELEEGDKYLSTAIPDWNKPETKKALIETGVALGYKPEEVAATRNPRDILALNHIRMLEAKVKEYEAAQAVANKQVRQAPPKVVRPQATQDASTQTRTNEGLQRLRKSGSDEDAVAALKALLG